MTSAVIAVRLFESLSEDPSSRYFAQGFRDDVVTELSRFPELATVTAEEEEDKSAVSHRLEGSIRRGEDRLRVSAQLIDSASGRHVWAEKFESRDEDPLSVQDEIACAVAGTLASHIADLNKQRARRTPITSLAAYECWLRGRECLERGTPEADQEARSYFERALEIDPQYPRAYAGISLSYYNDWSCQSWHLWSEGQRLAGEFAEKAVAHDDGDAITHVVLGRVRLYQRKFEQAQLSFDRALALNPNDKDVLAHVALWTFYLGKPDETVRLVERAMAVDPRHGVWLHGIRGLGQFALGRFAEAQQSLTTAGAAFVDFPATAAAAAALAGDMDAARALLAEFLTQFRIKITFGREPEPGEPMRWLIDANPFRRPADLERFLDGLRRAGLTDSAADAPAAARPADTPAEGNRFCRGEDGWTFAFDGTGARLVEVKGFHDLARLLASPGQPVHCLELAGAPHAESAANVLDPEAKRAYEARIRELNEDYEAAERDNDEGRAAAARAELDAVTQELTKALGLGGRSRKLGHPAERARSAATWRIRSAIKKIASAHPKLGLHLRNSVRTGTLCVYAPERETRWSV